MESRSIPFVVAVNPFDGAELYPLDEVRDSLDVQPGTPIIRCDARQRGQCKDVLLTCWATPSRRSGHKPVGPGLSARPGSV